MPLSTLRRTIQSPVRGKRSRFLCMSGLVEESHGFDTNHGLGGKERCWKKFRISGDFPEARCGAPIVAGAPKEIASRCRE
jgi:hypothetical protein